MFQQLLKDAHSRGIIVTSIVIDNLPAQLSGARNAVTTIEEPFNATSVIPCFCHLVNLIFVGAVSKCPELYNLINEVINLSTFIRKQSAVRHIKAKCPTIVRTRWLYIVDVLLFIFKHIGEINDYLQMHVDEEIPYDKIPIEFADLYLILLPLKILVLYFEKRSSKLHQVIPLFREGMLYFSQISDRIHTETGKKIFEIVLTCYLSRFKVNAKEQVIASYSLSIDGLKELREENDLCLENSDFEIVVEHNEFRDLMNLYQKEEYFHLTIHKIIETISNDRGPRKKIETIDQYFKPLNTKQEEEEDSVEDINQQINNEITTDSFIETFEEIDSLTIAEKLQYDPFKGETFYLTSLKIFKFIGQCLSLDLNYIEKMFTSYCYGDPSQFDNFEQLSSGNPDLFWRFLPSYNQAWKEFSVVAIRCLTVATSEAEVERMFSKDRQIAGVHGHQWGPNGLHNRAVIRTSESN